MNRRRKFQAVPNAVAAAQPQQQQLQPSKATAPLCSSTPLTVVHHQQEQTVQHVSAPTQQQLQLLPPAAAVSPPPYWCAGMENIDGGQQQHQHEMIGATADFGQQQFVDVAGDVEPPHQQQQHQRFGELMSLPCSSSVPSATGSAIFQTPSGSTIRQLDISASASPSQQQQMDQPCLDSSPARSASDCPLRPMAIHLSASSGSGANDAGGGAVPPQMVHQQLHHANLSLDSAHDTTEELPNMVEPKEKRKVPTAKDKLVDRKRFTMSDLVKWKPKTENTLRRKWAERRKQLKEEAGGETVQDQQQVLNAANIGASGGGQRAPALAEATQPNQQQQGPSSSSSSGSTPAATTPIAAAGPRVMINERGEMVVDEQSLVVVENPEQNTGLETVNDDLLPKRVTSLSFRRKPHRSMMWGVLETDLFYEVLSATGTDFGLMHEFIPTRTRVELKNKFNREERVNPRRLNEALQNPTMLDERLRHRVERMVEQMADQ